DGSMMWKWESKTWGIFASPFQASLLLRPPDNYQINGTSRYLTRFRYSAYPGRFFVRKCSSSMSRHIRKGIIAASGANPQYEPSASGVPKRWSDPPAYIGWRTMAYGPVEMTF